jgi:hypothetical protein
VTHFISKVEGLWKQADYQNDRTAEFVVEVSTTGPRGGAATDWLVHFNRHGHLAFAFRNGPGQTYFAPIEVPLAVSQAADKVWLTSPAWRPRMARRFQEVGA